jgi:hypothetical protein
MWWYLFFPSKSMKHCPSCSITKISQPPSPFLEHNHSIASIISLPLGVFSLFFYFVLIYFQYFCSFIRKLEFSIFRFAFHCQCFLHGVLLLHCYVGCHWHILLITLCCAGLGFQCQLFFGFVAFQATFISSKLSFFFVSLYNFFVFLSYFLCWISKCLFAVTFVNCCCH